MKILFIVSAFNGMSQRAWIELDRLNHYVKVHVFDNEDKLREAVDAFEPELILAPYLKRKIPAEIFTRYTCLIVHPGIVGDRGASSLDWAILEQEQEWGVTVVQAVEKMDAGPVWAAETFAMRPASKACLYRHEVTTAAMKAMLEAVRRFETGAFSPQVPAGGRWRRSVRQADFAFLWTDNTAGILRKIRAADSSPGVLAPIGNQLYYCYGAHPEAKLKGEPGMVIATRLRAVCVATGDGAVWLSHLKTQAEDAIKLPALDAMGADAPAAPEVPLSPFDPHDGSDTYREIYYEERNAVGYIHFDFYNGAMSADQCRRLQDCFTAAQQRPVKVIVLMGGMDLWSNGIDLNLIEASDNPPETSWENINAIDDLIESIIRCSSHYVISALHGNAGAGGVPFALAADKVIARKGIVLNPHTRNMGLYGSEYWTYLLPRRIGVERAGQFTELCLPWGTGIALEVKLLDECVDLAGPAFAEHIRAVAQSVASLDYFDKLLQAKQFKRRRDEAYKPLDQYRQEELEIMRRNFFDNDDHYDLRRYCFVHKKPLPENPRSVEAKDLFSERRKIWRRRKYESLFYDERDGE